MLIVSVVRFFSAALPLATHCPSGFAFFSPRDQDLSKRGMATSSPFAAYRRVRSFAL